MPRTTVNVPESDQLRTFKARVSFVAAKMGGPAALAAATGLSRAVIGKYLAGKSEPSRERLVALAQAGGVSLEWLATGLVRPLAAPLGEGERPPLAPGLIDVPVYDARASVGPGDFTDQDRVIDHIALGESWIRDTLRADPRRLMAVMAAGDSMSPTIESGDYLLVENVVGRPSDGAVYIVVRSGAVIVKRVRTAGIGAFLLQGDNPRAPDERVGPDDTEETRIVGRVRAVLRVT